MIQPCREVEEETEHAEACATGAYLQNTDQELYAADSRASEHFVMSDKHTYNDQKPTRLTGSNDNEWTENRNKQPKQEMWI